MVTLLTHASFIAWRAKAVRLANEEWRNRTPYRGESIMSREGLTHHLFTWGIGEGLIPDPGPRLNRPKSVYVAAIFNRNPEAIKAEARNYWRRRVDGQTKPCNHD